MLLSSPQSGCGDSCERRRDHTGDLRQVRSCFFLTSPSINRYKPSAHSHHFPGPQRPPLLTGMPPRERAKVDGAASPPDAGGDRISALPDDGLHHVLSFLPAEDVMRTCLLARRWRHLWKSAIGLRIGFWHGDRRPPSVDSLQHFVNHLLLLRKRDSCLHTCELRLWPRDTSGWLVEERISLNLWIRHVVEREVRMLRL